MHRIQIQLTEEQERCLRDLALLRGSSISALVREGIDALVAPEIEERSRRKERVLSVLGSFNSKAGDISKRHDEYLADDIAERKTRPRSK